MFLFTLSYFFLLKIKMCIYREKVSIPALKSFITIQGAGADKTIVQWGDTALTPNPGAKGQTLGTYGSATFAVNSPYFIAKNITFKVSNKTSLIIFLCFHFISLSMFVLLQEN